MNGEAFIPIGGRIVCLTASEQASIQTHVQPMGWPEQEALAWLQTYARDTASALATPGRACPPTPGEVAAVALRASARAREWWVGWVRHLISDAVRWVGSRVAHLEDPELRRWVADELEADAAILALALLDCDCQSPRMGCDCWQRWEDLSIESPVKAEAHCRAEHRLCAWDGGRPLQAFFRRALVCGHLRLPNRIMGKPECTQTNGFRRGMLAKLVAEQRLAAGHVLRCAADNCRGEVQINDRCDTCLASSQVKRTSWWLWRKGERLRKSCLRCLPNGGGCGFLYFQSRGGCPNCGQRSWHHTPVWVWVPTGTVPLDEAVTNGQVDGNPLDNLLAAETRVRFAAWLDGRALTDPEGATMLRRLVLEGWSLDLLAADRGLLPNNRWFWQWVRGVLASIPPGLIPEVEIEDNEADNEGEEEGL